MNPDTLLEQKLISEDPDAPGDFIFNVPLHITRAAILSGGFEMFAGAYGWESDPKNPEDTAVEASKRFIGKFVVDVVAGEVRKAMTAAANVQIEATINTLIGPAGRALRGGGV